MKPNKVSIEINMQNWLFDIEVIILSYQIFLLVTKEDYIT